ncbi:hypothetical protein Xentx_02989 [Xenorhabdus thuongxuanensis]|uniref:Uncharacterized protein n=1 Tax=Xenorhabdus thuongxuanensis TaxID=1873484 RepID=A0A1Q5TSZ5_9GAMM|nr:hypothetical protein Xentx_02989 [Xenorhabdus thuongxuanensis]
MMIMGDITFPVLTKNFTFQSTEIYSSELDRKAISNSSAIVITNNRWINLISRSYFLRHDY